MDFKKCSEVYGYKSIAEVEEEELEKKLAEHDEKIAKGLMADGVPDQIVMRQFNYTEDKISQLKAELATESVKS